ncbi:MAG: hypothetical protein WDN46_17545 [Methylocella sp.]
MTEHTPTPTSPMRSDSAYEAEIAGLKNRVDGLDQENARLNARLVAVEKERDVLAKRFNGLNAIISTACAASDAVEAAVEGYDSVNPSFYMNDHPKAMQAALTAANLKAIKIIEDAQAAPDAVEAMENAFWECDGNTSDSLKAALTAANINIAAEREPVAVDEVERVARMIARRLGHNDDEGMYWDRYVLPARLIAEHYAAVRELAEKAEAERDAVLFANKDLKLHWDVLKAEYDKVIAERDRLSEVIRLAHLQDSVNDCYQGRSSTMEDIFGKAPAYSSARYPAWHTAEHWRRGSIDPFAAPVDGESKP